MKDHKEATFLEKAKKIQDQDDLEREWEVNQDVLEQEWVGTMSRVLSQAEHFIDLVD